MFPTRLVDGDGMDGVRKFGRLIHRAIVPSIAHNWHVAFRGTMNAGEAAGDVDGRRAALA
jgi:hypothetical protein